MSFQSLSRTKPKARKNYGCIWCGESILRGDVHIKEASTYYGDFQSMRFHPECADAADRYWSQKKSDEFDPGGFRRGTTEER